jgi:hypothetical protein
MVSCRGTRVPVTGPVEPASSRGRRPHAALGAGINIFLLLLYDIFTFLIFFVNFDRFSGK